MGPPRALEGRWFVCEELCEGVAYGLGEPDDELGEPAAGSQDRGPSDLSSVHPVPPVLRGRTGGKVVSARVTAQTISHGSDYKPQPEVERPRPSKATVQG